MKRLLVICAALFALAVAIRVERLEHAHECNAQENCGVHDYKRVGRADTSKPHQITIWTSQNNFAASCSSMLLEISDPDSPKFGQQLSFEELKELVYDADALEAIHAFLDTHDISQEAREVAPNGEWIEVNTDIRTIETMFSAEFHDYHSEERQNTLTRSLTYIIPAEISEAVQVVAGISNFHLHHHRSMISPIELKRGTEQNSAGMYPQLIFKTYHLTNDTTATSKADMGVFETGNQFFSDNDLAGFQQKYHLPRQKVSKIIGPNSGSQCTGNPNTCTEATLDVEYIMAMAQGAPVTYWSVAPSNSDPFVEWIKAVSKNTKPPQVFSISYGAPEHLVPKSDQTLFSSEVCKMGLRGMTVFVASGDDGVAGSEARGHSSKCGFNPDFPANVPYVTTVGATMGPALNPPRDEEVCMSNKGSDITSGGGFSNVFSQPSWQTSAVSTYFKTAPNIPPKSMYGTGRGYPDVASLGNAYNILVGGRWIKVSGTSASSPVFCGMVALVNGAREAKGKKSIGYLNPILYKIDKSAYHDVTEGVNNCPAGQGTCCKYGFTATKGWDPATGWGSLDYPLFAKAVQNLP